MSPALAALLKDAALAAARGKPLYYCKSGFRDMRRNTAAIHSFLTVRAAERRGWVVTTGLAPRRMLHITSRGLECITPGKVSARRDAP